MENEETPLLVPIDLVAQIITDCEEYGESILYFREIENEQLQLECVDPTTITEVRENGRLKGFTQSMKGLPTVFFDVHEMMKLKLVR